MEQSPVKTKKKKKTKDSDEDSLQEITKQYTADEIEILKKPFDQEINIISNQMNWLHIEQKSRKNTEKLIKPVIEKSFEDRKAVLFNQQQNKLIVERLDKLEFYVFQERHIQQERNNQIRTLQDTLNELKNQEKELELKRLWKLTEQKNNLPVQRNSITSKGLNQRASVRFAPDTKEIQSLQKLIKAEEIMSIREEQNSITSNSSSSVQEEQNTNGKNEMKQLNTKIQKLEDSLMDVHNKLEEQIQQQLDEMRKDKHHTKLDEYDYKLDIMKASQFSHQKEIDSKFEQIWMKVTNQDFMISSQNNKIDIISQQQIKVEEKFEDIQDFINKKVLLLSDEIQKFQIETKTQLNNNQKQIDSRTKDVESFNKTLSGLFQINNQFTQNLEKLQIQIDKQVLNFEITVPTLCMKKEFEQSIKEIIATIKKLGQENMAQQFEINLMNNFVDKYLPLRLQHQISEQMRKTFQHCEYVQDLFVKYELVDSNVFEQLHQILFLDNGKADMLETISKMNTNIVRAEKLTNQNHQSFQNKYKIITEQKIFDQGQLENQQAYDENQVKTKQILEANQDKRNIINIEAQQQILQSLQEYMQISNQQMPQISSEFLQTNFQSVKKTANEKINQKLKQDIEQKKQNLILSKQQTVKKSLIEIKQTNNLDLLKNHSEAQKKKILVHSVQRDTNQLQNPNLEEIDENPESISFNQDEQISNDISLLNIQNNLGQYEYNEQEERQKKAKIAQMASTQDNQQVKIRAIQTAINSRHENSQISHDASFNSNQFSKKQIIIESISQNKGQIYNNKSQNQIQDQNVSFVQKSSNHNSVFVLNKNGLQDKINQGELQLSQQQINILDTSKSDDNLQSIQEKLEDQILDDNALASNIEKLIYPNKKRDEKILLDQRFEEVHKLIYDLKITHEQSMSSQLQIFTEKMTEVQKIGVEKLKYEIKEQRVYIQALQAQMENIEIQNKKKLQDFIEQKLKNSSMQNMESSRNPNHFESSISHFNQNFENKLKNIKMVCETLISILQINLTGTDLDNSIALNTNDMSNIFQNLNQNNSFITHRIKRPPTFNDEQLYSQYSDRFRLANQFPQTSRNQQSKYQAIIPSLFNKRNSNNKDLNLTSVPSQLQKQQIMIKKLGDSFQANKHEDAMRIYDGNEKNIYFKDSFHSSRTLFSSKQIQSSHYMQSQQRNINTQHQAFRNSAVINQTNIPNDLRSSTSDWQTIKLSQPNFVQHKQSLQCNISNNPLLIQENNLQKIEAGNFKKGINGMKMNLGGKQSLKLNKKMQNQQENVNQTINSINKNEQNFKITSDLNSQNEFNLLSQKSPFQKQDNKYLMTSQRRVLNLEAHIPREKIPEQLQINHQQTTEYINKLDSPFKIRGPVSANSNFDKNQKAEYIHTDNPPSIINIYKKQDTLPIQKNQMKQINDDLNMHSNTFTIILEENQNTDSTIQYENQSSAQNQSSNLKASNEEKIVNQSLNLSKLPFDQIQNQTMGSSPLSNLENGDEEQQSITVDIYSKKQPALQQKKNIYIINNLEKESSKQQNMELENQKKMLMEMNKNLLFQCTQILDQIQINEQLETKRDKKEELIMKTNDSTYKNSLGITSSIYENQKTGNMINIVVGKDSLPSLLGQSTPLRKHNFDRRNANHNSVNYSGGEQLIK